MCSSSTLNIVEGNADKNRTGITGSPRILNNGDDISRSPSDLLMPKSISRKVSFEDSRSPDHFEMSKG